MEERKHRAENILDEMGTKIDLMLCVFVSVCVCHDYYDIIIKNTMQWICVRLSVLCLCFIFVDGMLATSQFPLQFHESTIIIITEL